LEVSADAALLHRMIANLFDNELKHLPASCTVTISFSASEHSALLVVEDDGLGFESEVLSQIFERRVKGRNSTGHGLGLAFVEAVVRVHGGTIEASNRSEGGARLAITLPLAVNSKSPLSPAMAQA
jgi:signal transduction histidine kinase